VSTLEVWTFDAFGITTGNSCNENFEYSATMGDGSNLSYFISLSSKDRKFVFKSFSTQDVGTHTISLKGVNGSTSHTTSFKVKVGKSSFP